MSVLSFVVECDGFQHGLAPFSLRCMAIACGQTRSTYTRLFDTSELLQDGPAAFRTYQFQTQHHGLALAGQGLPKSMANSVLIHAINEILLELAEEGNPTPQLTLLWVKGNQKVTYMTELLSSCEAPPDLPIRVRNLEDAGCPAATKLEQEDPGPLMTHEKARLFAEWLLQKGLDSEPLARRQK